MCSHETEPSHGDKVRCSWAGLSPSGGTSGVVTVDAVLQTLQRIRIQLPDDAVRGALAKGAALQGSRIAGGLTYADWQAFGELYPTLLDCVYYRLRDEDYEREQEGEIADRRQKLDAERQKEQAFHEALAKLRNDIRDVSDTAATQHSTLRHLQESRRAACAEVDAVTAEAEQRKRELADKQQVVQGLREAERRVARDASEVARRCDDTRQRLRQSEDGVARQQQRLRQAEEQLSQARVQLNEKMMAAEECREEVRRATAEADGMLAHQDEIAARVAAAESDAAAVDGVLQQSRAAEQAAASRCRDVSTSLRDAEQVLERMVQGERELRRAEEDTRNALARQQAEVRRAEGAVDAFAKEQMDFAAQRHAVEQDERPLVEEEVLLRDERDVLEGRETVLRRQHKDLATRRQSPRTRHAASPGRGAATTSPGPRAAAAPDGRSALARVRSDAAAHRSVFVGGAGAGGGRADAPAASDPFDTSSRMSPSRGRSRWEPPTQAADKRHAPRPPDDSASNGPQRPAGLPTQCAGSSPLPQGRRDMLTVPQQPRRLPSPNQLQPPSSPTLRRPTVGHAAPVHQPAAFRHASPALRQPSPALRQPSPALRQTSPALRQTSPLPRPHTSPSRMPPHSQRPGGRSPRSGLVSPRPANMVMPTLEPQPSAGSPSPIGDPLGSRSAPRALPHDGGGLRHRPLFDAAAAAGRLDKAMSGLCANDGAVYSTLRQVSCEADWEAVKRSFSSQARTTSPTRNAELVSVMRQSLSAYEIDNCRRILAESSVALR